MFRRFESRLQQRLGNVSFRERILVKGVATVTAVLGTALPVIQYIEIDQILDPAHQPLWGVVIGYTAFWLRVRIAIALVINLVSTWPFKAKAFVLSALALLWATLEYVLWFNWSLRVIDSLGTEKLPTPSAAGFYHAVWLDVAVMGLTALLLARTANIILLSLLSAPRSQQNIEEAGS